MIITLCAGKDTMNSRVLLYVFESIGLEEKGHTGGTEHRVRVIVALHDMHMVRARRSSAVSSPEQVVIVYNTSLANMQIRNHIQ